MLHILVLRKKKTVDGSLYVYLICSAFHCSEDLIWGTVHQYTVSPKQRAWAPVLQHCSLKQTRIKLSVGASPCLILSKSLRSSDRLLEVTLSNASPSPPSVWPASAAQCWVWGCLSRVGRVGCATWWDSSRLLFGDIWVNVQYFLYSFLDSGMRLCLILTVPRWFLPCCSQKPEMRNLRTGLVSSPQCLKSFSNNSDEF